MLQARRVQHELYLQKLPRVLAQLEDELPDARYDARGVGQLILQLAQFQESALGRDVRRSSRRCSFLDIAVVVWLLLKACMVPSVELVVCVACCSAMNMSSPDRAVLKL